MYIGSYQVLVCTYFIQPQKPPFILPTQKPVMAQKLEEKEKEGGGYEGGKELKSSESSSLDEGTGAQPYARQ